MSKISSLCPQCVSCLYIPYSRKLSREKTFANFMFLWLFAKVFSAKFEGMSSLAQHKRAIRESFLHETRIFHQFAKVFSLESFPAIRYNTTIPTFECVDRDVSDESIKLVGRVFILIPLPMAAYSNSNRNISKRKQRKE